MSLDLISQKEVLRYIRQGRAVVLDLRDKEAFCKSHIPGAVLMPYDTFDETSELLNAYEILILCCDRGSASLQKGRMLSDMGYTVFSIVGGMEMWRGPTVNECF